MATLISATEREYIRQGVDYNFRNDGRGRLDYRQIFLETGHIPHASGSARCQLKDGTDVLVGVKVEIGQIDIDGTEDEQFRELKSNRGRVVCNVECSPIAAQRFAGRGADEINNEFTQTLDRVLSGPQGGLDLEKLCIIPGAQCWVVYIDASVHGYAGNIMDIIFITTRAALFNTRVPKTVVHDLGEGQLEFDVSDDTEDAERIAGWEGVPIGVTLNKIGSRYIADATPQEELTTEAKLLIAINKDGKICGLQKSGTGGIEPSLLHEMVQTGRSIGQNLIQRLDAYLWHEENEAAAKRARGEPVEKLGYFTAL